MAINDYNKAREVLTRVHEFLSNLCRDARCDDHCSECLGASDLADDVYDLIYAPPRNCDIGTEEEQAERQSRFCLVHRCGPDCPAWRDEQAHNGCVLAWAQMPFEEGGADGVQSAS